ncbi:MAG TPA: hypothetical protein VM095_08500 [Pyrinomonadaceae bacterium]|nr:hypothetical protein [Pyrinomonadaceae bacterium]
MKIAFDKAEMEWLSRAASRYYASLLHGTVIDAREATRDVAKALMRKCDTAAEYVNVNRHELRALESLTKLSMQALELVRAEYASRGESAKEYATRAEEKAALLMGLQRKIERALNT